MGSVAEALGITLPLALGIAAAPWAIISLIILLMTPRAVSNAYAFLMGWFLGLILVGFIILKSPGLETPSGEPSRLMGWIRIGMGGVFLLTSLLFIRKIPKKEDRKTIPGWIRKIDTFGFVPSFLVGIFHSTLNLKNSSMLVVGAASIGRQGLNPGQEFLALVFFCLIASTGVLIPHIIFVLFRSNAERIFGKIKIWILKNRVLVLLLILIIFGGISLLKGFMILKHSNFT